MRPLVKGQRPQDAAGHDIQFRKYVSARGELIRRLGQYCSYCEARLGASLAVEHKLPKKPDGVDAEIAERVLDWDNFLLSCVNCNSTKGAEDVDLDDYLWPDQDNTFRGLRYAEGGVVTPSEDLEPDIIDKAKNIISLVGLDKTPNDAKASDRRWFNRNEAWEIAQRARERLARNNTNDFRNQIMENALANGFWSVWMTVFEDDADMLALLIEAFPGTCADCFDGDNGYASVHRAGGRC